MISIETAQRAMEMVGESSLAGLIGSFGEMSQEDIEAELARMYPQDNPDPALAGDIYLTCQSADWLREQHPRYFT